MGTHLHEHVFRKVPRAIVKAIAERVLEGAAKAEILQSNRDALYETADILERELRRQSTGKSASSTVPADGGSSAAVSGNSSSTTANASTQSKSRKRKRGAQATASGEADPTPAEKAAKGASKRKKTRRA